MDCQRTSVAKLFVPAPTKFGNFPLMILAIRPQGLSWIINLVVFGVMLQITPENSVPLSWKLSKVEKFDSMINSTSSMLQRGLNYLSTSAGVDKKRCSDNSNRIQDPLALSPHLMSTPSPS